MENSIDELQSNIQDGELSSSRTIRIILLGIASAVLFSLGLLATELLGEIGVDIDFKPFFIPYLLIALTRSGIPTLSVGLGAAIGEGALDVFEGYELDDPVGFIGYVVGFNAFGWYLHEVAEDPNTWKSLSIGAILGALVQAIFEGIAFLIFKSTTGSVTVGLSVLGNTFTHGILLGAVPLLTFLPWIRKRIGLTFDL